MQDSIKASQINLNKNRSSQLMTLELIKIKNQIFLVMIKTRGQIERISLQARLESIIIYPYQNNNTPKINIKHLTIVSPTNLKIMMLIRAKLTNMNNTEKLNKKLQKDWSYKRKWNYNNFMRSGRRKTLSNIQIIPLKFKIAAQ